LLLPSEGNSIIFEIDKIRAIRNDIVHGVWIAVEVDGVPLIQKTSRNAKQLKVEWNPKTVEEMNKLSEQISEQINKLHKVVFDRGRWTLA